MTIQPNVARERLREMIRIRRFEEACAELYSAGKIRGFLHLYVGEEAIASGVMPVLDTDDAIVSTYREHGHALARGVPMGAVLAEMFGKREGCSRGRGGSMHLFDVSRRFYGGNAIVAGGIPLAVGLALADAMHHDQSNTASTGASSDLPARRITACFFGDGATAEGAFHESMNLAALWRLPVLFLCENNQYAMGTALPRYQSETDLARKAESYRVLAERVDGMNVVAVEEAARRGTEHVRAGRGPYFIEFVTYRFRAHSMFDPDLYRDKAEIERWKLRDPIKLFVLKAVADGALSEADVEGLERDVAEEIAEAIAFAEQGSWEPASDLTKDVLTETAVEASQ
jgi:pyruvate dehydrogenase E1 component alpha subunit